ncbi:MAG: hypothetical protein IPO44_18765 [Candidatus Microthrix sp.]|nr:hypothetical protein [Candidatus Microthrix sp.]MBK9561512.1 hypothetical protein [Candidatus Microthrix sp.]
MSRPISQYDTVVAIDHAGGALWAVTASGARHARRRCEPLPGPGTPGADRPGGTRGATGEIEAALARSSRLPHTSA